MTTVPSAALCSRATASPPSTSAISRSGSAKAACIAAIRPSLVSGRFPAPNTSTAKAS